MSPTVSSPLSAAAPHSPNHRAAESQPDLLTDTSRVKSATGRKLVRQWRAAYTSNLLPAYEDIALGSMGRLAEYTGVIRFLPNQDPHLLRLGETFRSLMALPHTARTLTDMHSFFSRSIEHIIFQARLNERPSATVCRWPVEGRVSTIELLALPLSCRWPGEYFLVCANAQGNQIDLSELLLNSALEGVLVLSPVASTDCEWAEFCIINANEPAARLLGMSPAELQFSYFLQSIQHMEAAPLLKAGLTLLHRGQRVPDFEISYEVDREHMDVRVSLVHIDGLVIARFTDIHDVKIRETLFRSLFDRNPVPMYVRQLGSSGFTRVNTAALRLYGYDRDTFLSKPILGVFTEVPEDCTPEGVVELSTRHQKATGEAIDVIEYSTQVVVDNSPAILSTIIDITKRKEAEDHITYLAHHDSLTGAANRAGFSQACQRAFDDLHLSNEHFALMLVDLDDFKMINDRYGHDVGDFVLSEVVNQLKKSVRNTDIVARLGGDEFAVLIKGSDNRDIIKALAMRCLENMATIGLAENEGLRVCASIGIALAPTDAASATDLFKSADIALYQAKHGGKNILHFFESDIDCEVSKRREIEMELRRADIEQDFVLLFQPIFGQGGATLRGFEALLRWHHPRLGSISPSEFIPLAEQTGVIDALGRWVLRRACEEAATWPEHLYVAVNASAAQFRRGTFVQTVKDTLGKTQLHPARLQIEVTETVFLDDSSKNISALDELHTLGVTIALDDFGVGYSAMRYLIEFPFDRIKIDQSFIRVINNDDKSLAIVRAMIGIGANMGMKITAEGVETSQQLDSLVKEGCSEFQGFLFSYPLSLEDTAQLIKKHG